MDNLAWPIKVTRKSYECGRKPEHPEETHANTGRMRKLHTDSDPSRESNQGPRSCEAALLTAVPSSDHRSYLICTGLLSTAPNNPSSDNRFYLIRTGLLSTASDNPSSDHRPYLICTGLLSTASDNPSSDNRSYLICTSLLSTAPNNPSSDNRSYLIRIGLLSAVSMGPDTKVSGVGSGVLSKGHQLDHCAVRPPPLLIPH